MFSIELMSYSNALNKICLFSDVSLSFVILFPSRTDCCTRVKSPFISVVLYTIQIESKQLYSVKHEINVSVM